MEGNQMKMREAVVALLDALDSLGCDESTAKLAAFVPDMADSSARCLAAFRKAKDALAAPPRQCDVGTPEEQIDLHREWCRCDNDSSHCCNDCRDCFARWAQTPHYEKKEVKNESR